MTVDGLIMDAAICNSDFQFCNCPLCFFSWLTASLCSLCCNHGEWKINQISWEPRSAPLAGGDSLCIAARTCYRGWLLSVTSSFVRNLSLNIFLSSQIENLCRQNKPDGLQDSDPNVAWPTCSWFQCGKKINEEFSEVSFLFPGGRVSGGLTFYWTPRLWSPMFIRL